MHIFLFYFSLVFDQPPLHTDCKLMNKPICIISTLTQKIRTSVKEQQTNSPTWNQDATLYLP